VRAHPAGPPPSWKVRHSASTAPRAPGPALRRTRTTVTSRLPLWAAGAPREEASDVGRQAAWRQASEQCRRRPEAASCCRTPRHVSNVTSSLRDGLPQRFIWSSLLASFVSGLLAYERLAVGDDDDAVVDKPSSSETAVVSLGRNGPSQLGSHAFVLTVRPSEQAVLVCSEDR